jgi:hypothetical protein
MSNKVAMTLAISETGALRSSSRICSERMWRALGSSENASLSSSSRPVGRASTRERRRSPSDGGRAAGER